MLGAEHATRDVLQVIVREVHAIEPDAVAHGADRPHLVDVQADKTKLSVKRGHVHQTPTYKNFIYSIGGRGNDGLKSIGTIDVGTFDP